MIADRPPLPLHRALWALFRCAVATFLLLARGVVSQPRSRIGTVLRFANGTDGRIYRETVIADACCDTPAVLVVCFRLRCVHGWGHTLFRVESLFNTPLFVGFPGFVSKLWLAHDENEVYRGFYQWNNASLADAYARALWWVLALVSERDSIRYTVLPGFRRDDVLAVPAVLDRLAQIEDDGWWKLRKTEMPAQIQVSSPLAPRLRARS